MGDPLFELIKMICDESFVHRGPLVEHLKDEYKYEVGNAEIEDCVRRFLYENGLSRGLANLIDDFTLLKMAREKGQTCPKDMPQDEVIKKLLISFGLAFPPELIKPQGARSIRNKLRDMQQSVDDGGQRGRVSADIRNKPLDAWSYVEKLLRITIQFYEQVLAQSDQSVNEAFINHEFGQIKGGRAASHEAYTSGKLVV